MRVAAEWLEEILGPLPPAQEVAQILTMQGLEVEEVAWLGEGLLGAEVACIRSLRPHGGHLQIVELETLDGLRSVVTGAKNVAPMQLVPWAKPGATLPDGRVLATAEFLGVESTGMLLSAAEIGLGEERDGILILDDHAVVGSDVAQHLGLPRAVFDIALTPSFATHCQSALGVARELAARLGRDPKGFPPVMGDEGSAGIEVDVASAEICPAYLGSRFVRERAVDTPLWMRLRLLSAGMRSVHPFVDLTNYVMLEIGQPLHPFALDRIEGPVTVRLARRGEVLRTLDGVERRLDQDDIVIADRLGVVALAGVMGSERAEMSENTEEVFLEAALFDPARIARTSRKEALRSEAAQRFMHLMDPTLPWRAVRRMRELAPVVGFRPLAGISASAPLPGPRAAIVVDPQRVRTLLGIELDDGEQVAALGRLGFAAHVAGGKIAVEPPPHRPDVRMLADVAEEVLRAVGIERLGERLPPLGMTLPEPEPYTLRLEALEAFVRLGYRQTVSYSLEDPRVLEAIGRPLTVRLANPLAADASALRPTLLTGLLAAVRRNHAHGVEDVALVEAGTVFSRGPGDEVREEPRIALALFAEGGTRRSRFAEEPADFFALKGDVLAGLSALRVAALQSVRSSDPLLHPGRQARLLSAGQEIGTYGEVHPALAETLSLPARVLLAEFSLLSIATARIAQTARPLPRFPALWRDVAVVVSDSVAWQDVETAVREAAGPLLEELHLFDVYPGGDGRAVPSGQSSLGLRLQLRSPERTLTDGDAEDALTRVLGALEREVGARLR